RSCYCWGNGEICQRPAGSSCPRHEMGEKRISLIGTVSFERANFNHPFAAAAVYYNDEAGIRAMSGAVAWERRIPVLPDPAAAVVTIELRDQSGRILPGLIVGDRWFVVGEEGRR